MAFTGLYEVRSDLAFPHLQNLPAAAVFLALNHLALNMFLVQLDGHLLFFTFIHYSKH